MRKVCWWNKKICLLFLNIPPESSTNLIFFKPLQKFIKSQPNNGNTGKISEKLLIAINWTTIRSHRRWGVAVAQSGAKLLSTEAPSFQRTRGTTSGGKTRLRGIGGRGGGRLSEQWFEVIFPPPENWFVGNTFLDPFSFPFSLAKMSCFMWINKLRKVKGTIMDHLISRRI